MKKLLEAVTKLTAEELKNSYIKFPKFNSPHEGYAVILEEYEELKSEVLMIEEHLDSAWVYTKLNRDDVTKGRYLKLRQKALNAAAESIQVAAMAQKFIDSFEVQNEQ